MATTNSIVDSMCTFLDQHIEQHKEEMMKGLKQYIDTEVNDRFDKLKSELSIWARANLSGLRTDACNHHDVFNIVDRPESPSSTLPEASSSQAETPRKSAELRINEKQSNSPELLDQVLLESENGLNGTRDEVCDSNCDCTNCDAQLGDLLKPQPETDSKKSRKPQRKSCTTISERADTPDSCKELPFLFGSDSEHEENDYRSKNALANPPEANDNDEMNIDEDQDEAPIVPVKLLPRTPAQQPMLSNILAKTRLISVKCLNDGCTLDFGNHEALCRHMAEVHKIKKYRCLQRGCNKSYVFRMELAAHIRIRHNDLTDFQCSLCLRFFVSHDRLANHHTMNHVIGRFECNFSQCQYTGTNQKDVRRHYLATHKGHACTFPGCGKVFLSKTILNDHERSHLGMKTFYCNWPEGCTYSCNDRSTMVAHIRVKHFKLPKSTREQRQLGISDRRNASDYYRTCRDDSPPANLPSDVPDSFLSTFHQHRPSRTSRPLKPRVYQCKWNACDYETEYRRLIQDHVQKVHGPARTGMVSHTTAQ